MIEIILWACIAGLPAMGLLVIVVCAVALLLGRDPSDWLEPGDFNPWNQEGL